MANQDERQITIETDPEETKIMVVDDEVSILKFMKHALQDNGYKVTVCSDAEYAIEEIKKEIYDLIITDLNMPKISGIEFVKKARKISPKTDLVVITGFPSVETAVQCMSLVLLII